MDVTTKWNRPGAQEWLESLRDLSRCKWCGEDGTRLNKQGLCDSCRKVEREIADTRARITPLLASANRFQRRRLSYEIKVVETIKDQRIASGNEVRGILHCDDYSALKLEHEFCAVAGVICGNDRLHAATANALGQTFTTEQRRVLAYLFWKAFQATRKRTGRHSASNGLIGRDWEDSDHFGHRLPTAT